MKSRFSSLILCLAVSMLVPECRAALNREVIAVLNETMPLNMHLANPIFNINLCHNFWIKNGLVCDPSLLKTYVLNDAAAVSKAQLEFNNTLDYMQSILTLIGQDAEKYIPQLYNSFKTSIYPQFLTQYKNNATICWDQMRKMRSSSVCTTCSNINYKYYLKGRGAVSGGDCDTVFTKCFEFFDKLAYRVQEPVYIIYLIVSKIDPTFTWTAYNTATANMASSNSLVTHLNSYKAAVAAKDTLKASYEKAFICQGTIRINRKPLLTQYVETKKAFITDALMAYSNAKSRALSNWKPFIRMSTTPAARRLELDDFFSFDEDIYVAVSSGDAANTMVTIDGAPFLATTMNFTMCFP